jgi:hypothetical protein
VPHRPCNELPIHSGDRTYTKDASIQETAYLRGLDATSWFLNCQCSPGNMQW